MEKLVIQASPSSCFILLPAFRQPIINPYLFTHIMTHTSPAVWRQKIGAVVLHQTTQLAILLIIVLNAIILGLQTSPAIMARCGALLHWLDMAALIIFIVELAAKFIALGRRFFGSVQSTGGAVGSGGISGRNTRRESGYTKSLSGGQNG